MFQKKEQFDVRYRNKEFIGVDLDGTLAERNGGNGKPIGKPVKAMVDRVNQWLEGGHEVKIFTARAGDKKEVKRIKDWLDEHDLPALAITNIKELGMVEFWDDRAIRVEIDKGRPCRTCNSARKEFTSEPVADEVDFL